MTDGEFAERPWGTYTVLSDDAPDHKVKRIVVRPGKRLSYQRHAKRAEHWFIVSGRARVTLDGSVTTLSPGQAIDIPTGAAHRVALGLLEDHRRGFGAVDAEVEHRA